MDSLFSFRFTFFAPGPAPASLSLHDPFRLHRAPNRKGDYRGDKLDCHTVVVADDMPALIVAYSLLSCAVMMGLLAVGDSRDRSVLLAFTGALAALGAVTLLAQYWSPRQEGTH